MTDSEFEQTNGRRAYLILKRSSRLTLEERIRPYRENPGWEEESEKIRQMSLSPGEHAELAQLQKECREYMAFKYPSALADPALTKLLDQYAVVI